MTPERWQEVAERMEKALRLDPGERSSYLAKLANEDPELHGEVESLLASHEQAGPEFLQTPVGQVPSAPHLPTPCDDMLGRRVGAYQVVERIGAGGMGEVYRAFRADDQYRKQVALKVVRAGQDSGFVISRFKNERQILASLDHPNIARLLDGGTTEDGAPYFVMELIEGESIDRYCDHRELTISDRLKLFLEVCSAVQFAHQRLIIHRDIKPSNILVTADGTPKLLDFGIAKILDTEADTDQFVPTLTVFRMLTPGYASPEQIKGEPITTASDVYSLGVVLYELLTAHSPYRVTSRSAQLLARAVCESEPEKPSTAVLRESPDDCEGNTRATPATFGAVREGSSEKLRKRLRGDLDNIVLMALRKEPQRRYASVEQLAADIRRHLDDLPVIARKDTVRYRTSKFVARHRAGVAAAALVLVTLIAALVVTLHEAHIARVQQARAEARFNDVRKLANSFMFDFDHAIQNIPGTTHAREMVVKTALQYLDSLARESHGDPSLQDELATAYENVGTIQGGMGAQSTGNTSAALDSYNKAITIRKALLRDDPTNPVARHKLAFTYLRIGGMLGQANDFAGALENDRTATAIYEALLAANPSDATIRRDEARSYQQLAYHSVLKGDFSPAVDNYRKAISIFEGLLSTKPDDQQSLFELAHTYRLISFALRNAGDKQGALDIIRKCIPLNEQIARDAPNNVRAKLDLASAYMELADSLESGGDLRGGLENWQKAVVIGESVTKVDSNDVRAKLLLADGYARTDILQMKLGKSTELTGVLKSLEIRRQLLSADPQNGGRKEALAESYERLGDAESLLASNKRFTYKAGLDHWRKARSWYQQALDILLELRGQNALRAYDAKEPDIVAKAIAKCDAALAGQRSNLSSSSSTLPQ